MYRSYLTVAFRHLKRQKGYAFINMMSLSLGIACALFILLFIRDELSYDRYHEKADRIFRVVAEERQGDQVSQSAAVLMPTASFMREDFPEVEEMVRFVPPGNAWMIRHGTKAFYERAFYLADGTVFDVFDVHLVAGNPRTALTGNDKVVLSESIARKYFGDEDPMGKILDADGAFHFEVTGVMRDLPSNTHLGFDMLASFEIQEAYLYHAIDEWSWSKAHSYILLREGSDPDELEAKLPAFVRKHLGHRYGNEEASLTLSLQPVTDIHLHSRLEEELAPNGDIRYLYIFSATAVFIVLIACVNYMNLATARSAGRAREIGLRKVFGALRSQVARQFLIESLVMCSLAICLAFLMVIVGLTWFNMLTGKVTSLDTYTALFAVGTVVVVGLIVGCISGSYPALYLSRLAPIQAVQGPAAGGGLRKTLVVGQFGISIAVIVCTGIVYNQLDYIRMKNLGLNASQVVAVPLTYDPVVETSRVYKQRVQESPYVVSANVTRILPGYKNALVPATVRKTGQGDEAKVELFRTWSDEDFLKTFQIDLVAGRFFDPAFPGDWVNDGSVVLNQAAVEKLGYGSAEEAVGLQFERLRELRRGYAREDRELHSIIGVMKNFHFASLHEPIEPLILFSDFRGRHVVIRIDAAHVQEGLAAIEEAWTQVNPDFAFEYTFVDDIFARLYESEQRFGRIFVSFAALAVVIACLGLFGLSSFTAERRTKEIGVRKVLGASIPNLFGMLSSEFVRLVIVANVLAWPVAYIAMNTWLGGFAYRVDLGWATFILAGVLAMGIALLTVSFQAVRAATANPVESLRTE